MQGSKRSKASCSFNAGKTTQIAPVVVCPDCVDSYSLIACTLTNPCSLRARRRVFDRSHRMISQSIPTASISSVINRPPGCRRTKTKSAGRFASPGNRPSKAIVRPPKAKRTVRPRSWECRRSRVATRMRSTAPTRIPTSLSAESSPTTSLPPSSCLYSGSSGRNNAQTAEAQTWRHQLQTTQLGRFVKGRTSVGLCSAVDRIAVA